MKTVVQVVQHLSPGGLESMAIALKKANDEKAKMIIVSLEGNKTDALRKWARLENISNDIIFLEKKPGLDTRTLFKLIKLFRKIKPKTVHTHHIGPLIYGGLAARIARVPQLIHTEHDAWHLEQRKRRIVQRAILGLTRPTIIADAHSVATNLKKHLNTAHIDVVTNGIDVQFFTPGDQASARKTLNLPADKKIIGCSGRVIKLKGHDIAINALKNLPEDVHLAIAGNGDFLNTLQSLAESCNVKDRVHFLGMLNDMPTFYQSLDIFCLPSLKEGMPLAPLEAQACGVPSIVTNTGGSAETLCQVSGVLITTNNANAIAEAVTKLLKRDTQKNPRPFVEKFGNVNVMAEAYAKICHINEEAA